MNQAAESIAKKPRTSNFKDITGQVFGKLTVLQFAGVQKEQSRWLCQCECGSLKIYRGDLIRCGRSKSCGCVGISQLAEMATKHGHASDSATSSEYKSWEAMRGRCLNPRHKKFSYYGGRGIKVCDRWDDFQKFLDDMGPKPSPKHSIDRIDVNGDYEPENCRWADKKTQENNRRNNRKVCFRGQLLTAAEIAGMTGINYNTLRKRIKLGYSEERLAEPPKNTKKTL